MTAQGLVSRASPVQTAVRNCTRDEGGPFGFGDQVADPKPPQAAVAKSHGGKRCGNVGTTIPAGTVERGERKRTVAEVKVPITAAWRASRRPGTGQKRRARRRGVQSSSASVRLQRLRLACRSGARLIPILATRHGRARPGHACLWTDILNQL